MRCRIIPILRAKCDLRALLRCIYRKFTPGYPEDARTLRGLAFILRCVPSARILRCVPSGRVAVALREAHLLTIGIAGIYEGLCARRLEPKKNSCHCSA